MRCQYLAIYSQTAFQAIGALASAVVITIIPIAKTTAQIPLLQILQTSSNINNNVDNKIVSGWIYLDGRRLFQISATKTSFPERLQNIQQNLQEISENYLRSSATTAKIDIQTLNDSPVIYVNDRYLMTITNADIEQTKGNSWSLANQITQTLQRGLQEAKQERRVDFLLQQGVVAGVSALIVMIMSGGIYRWQRREQKKTFPTAPDTQSITIQLNQQHQQHLREVKKRLFQLAQLVVWGTGSFIILGLFPYTRPFQIGILTIAEIPLHLGAVFLGTYMAIRFSYALIDHSASTIVSGTVLLTPEASERLQMRASTFSGVTKSITTIIWIGVGILLALIFLGIDIVPLLAGAGLIGVAVGVASQNLLKDAINGFLIIIEDQYALGDVITVGDVGGLVENLNLRITQVRDSQGRLITIPNSEIKIVANLSSHWSRADLTIPIPYEADIDGTLELIENVALAMNQDPQWKYQILETPKVLGIDSFGDRGLMIRVWIKTQPLKQWDIAREYNRRIKIALDKMGIVIPVNQQAVWLHQPQGLKSTD